MTGEKQDSLSNEMALQMVADIVTAYIAHNPLPSEGLPELIQSVHGVLRRLAEGRDEKTVDAASQKPAVPIRKSVTDEYIVCLEDGKKLKMLKRYLRTHHDMSPEEYRAKWNLPADYPMVAPAYARRRSELAKKIGLGQKGRKRRAASA